MNVKKNRMRLEIMDWNEDGYPIWREWYGVERRTFDKWFERMNRRCKGDWVLGRKMLAWRKLNKPRWVMPKLRKEYNNRYRYRFSREFIEGKIEEVISMGGIPSTNVLAKKLGVHWLTMHRRMKEFGIDLKERKPIGLHGKPLEIYVGGR